MTGPRLHRVLGSASVAAWLWASTTDGGQPCGSHGKDTASRRTAADDTIFWASASRSEPKSEQSQDITLLNLFPQQQLSTVAGTAARGPLFQSSVNRQVNDLMMLYTQVPRRVEDSAHVATSLDRSVQCAMIHSNLATCSCDRLGEQGATSLMARRLSGTG
eukprot:6462523-Amphidinium_carterae.1